MTVQEAINNKVAELGLDRESKKKSEEVEEKKWYTITLSAEEDGYGNVLLTEKEARFVASVIDQMYEHFYAEGGGWCGSVSIDIENPRKDAYDHGTEY